jgi:V/A-type H+/Na+-transporting ATPase subunit I
MIAPMKKFSFLVYHQDYLGFLGDVRKIGVLHLIQRNPEVADEVREKYDLIRQIQSLVKNLEKRESGKPKPQGKLNGEEAFRLVSGLFDEQESKYQQLLLLNKEISLVKTWGDFSMDTLDKLKQQDLHVRFYNVPTSKFNESWFKEYPIEVIGMHAGQTYFVLIQQGAEEPDIEAEEVRAPERPLSELLHYQSEIKKEIAQINEQINAHAVNSMEAIKKYGYEVKESAEYKQALEDTEKQAEEKVMLLEGWVPEAREDELLAYLEQKNILYLTQKPTVKDNAPILLKNKKFSEKFEMLGELYSLPKYAELDMTPFFAPFYMLFFGFCLGDAGYGLLMVAATLFLKKKVKRELKAVMSLIFYLGLSTILFGIVGGTVFGIPLYDTNLPVYRTLSQRFTEQGTDINQLLFYLALLFGAAQILFGMFLKVINEVRQFGWGFAIGTIGWITLLIGGVGIYLISHFADIPMDQMRTPLTALFIVSGIMILPLNNLSRNVFMNVGVGLWTTYNMVTGILGDLLSYIRLFALGISSAIMGFVFNSLAVEMSGSIPVLSILIMIIILVIGHSINIFMSGLGAFVHPLRLTFVEFYKNAGFSGGGKQYNPFRKIT